MASCDLESIAFSHSEIAQYGQLRLRETLTANQYTNIDFTIPSSKVRFIYSMRVGDVTKNTCYISFVNLRNWGVGEVLVGTEQLNIKTDFYPLLIAKGTATLKVKETSGSDQTGEFTLDYFDMNERLVKNIEESVQASGKFSFKV